MKKLEIVIVLIVVGILGWITWSQFDLAEKKSRDVERKTELHEISKVIKLYYADYGKLPEESLMNSLYGKEWRDGSYVYMKQVPKEDYSDQEYCYKTYDSKDVFGLLTNLENKKDTDCFGRSIDCGGKKYCFEDKMSAIVINQ